MRRQWTKEQLEEILRAKAEQLGRAPTTLEINDDYDLPSPPTFAKFLGNGSWTEAIKSIGMEPHQRYTNSLTYTKEKLIECLKAKAKALGRAPTSAEMDADPSMPSHGPYVRCFGSWNKALETVGLKPSKFWYRSKEVFMHKKWTKEELEALLRAKAEQLGRAPTSLEINDDLDLPVASTFSKFLGNGSWTEAIKSIGLEPHQRYTNSLTYTKEELIECLKAKAKELGHTPTAAEMLADPTMPSASPYNRCFGSWNKALEAAGLSLHGAHTGKRYSDEYLIETLQAKAAELGRSPSRFDMDVDPAMPTVETYAKRFKTWTQALAAAGLEPPKSGRRRKESRRP